MLGVPGKGAGVIFTQSCLRHPTGRRAGGHTVGSRGIRMTCTGVSWALYPWLWHQQSGFCRGGQLGTLPFKPLPPLAMKEGPEGLVRDQDPEVPRAASCSTVRPGLPHHVPPTPA